MKAYILIMVSMIIFSCSRSTGSGNIIYDHAAITQLSNKSVLKEQKLHKKAVLRKREELALYENKSPGKKPKH